MHGFWGRGLKACIGVFEEGFKGYSGKKLALLPTLDVFLVSQDERFAIVLYSLP